MPWSKSDVDNFKSGLSDSQKERWVSIANSILRECLDNGGTQEDCESKAIRIANSRIDENSNNSRSNATINNLHHNMSQLVEHREMDGRDYIVAPTVMIVEGILNNVYYPASEMAVVPQHWNGRPVVVEHSTQNDGSPKTANDPYEREKRTVGWIYNTQYVEENGQAKLKAQAWIDPEKCKEVEEGEDVLNKLENNEGIEVSTGVFTLDVNEPGYFNGERYDSIATELRGDHLALLPNGTGACSWVDGAGLPRLNKRQNSNNDNQTGESQMDKLQKFLENSRHSPSLNEKGMRDLFRDMMNTLEQKYETGPDNQMVFIEEIFPQSNEVVFEIEKEGVSTFYRQQYNADENEISLNGDPVEVEVKTEYVQKQQEQKQKENSEMQRNEMIQYLIDNSPSVNEEHRQMLENSTDAVLNMMVNTVKSASGNGTEQGGDANGGTTSVNTNQDGSASATSSSDNDGNDQEEQPKGNSQQNQSGGEENTSQEDQKQNSGSNVIRFNSEQELIDALPEGELKESISEAVTNRENERTQLINSLSENSRCEFGKQELEEFNLNDLRKISRLAQVPTNEGKQGGPSANASKQGRTKGKGPQMPTVNWHDDKKIEIANQE